MSAVPKTLVAVVFAALLATLPWGGQAHAAVQRSFLLQSCTTRDQAKLAGCDAYFAGVLETVQLLQTDGAVKREVCVPERVELRQLREGVVSYLQAHPGGGPATPGVLEAMRSLYHC